MILRISLRIHQLASFKRVLSASLVVALIVFVGEVIRYQVALSNYRAWDDEAETVVTARMLASGGLLYKTIFNQHGPLVFLSGYVIEMLSHAGIRVQRIPIFFLQWWAVAAFALAPVQLGWKARSVLMFAAATVVVAFLPRFLAQTYEYQSMAGPLVMIAMALWVVPVVLGETIIPTASVVIGSAALASLPFLAVTYGPAAALLLIASWRRSQARLGVASAAVTVALNVLFIAVKGSIAGYLAYHIYLNLFIYPPYSEDPPISSTFWIMGLAFLIGTAAVLAVSSRSARFSRWRGICLVAGISTLLVRGFNFQALPFFYGLIGMTLLTVGGVATLISRVSVMALVIVLVCMLKMSLLLPSDRHEIASKQISTSTPFGNLAKYLTDPSERIIVYSFANFQYLAADRLPASGDFYLLPSQTIYERHPLFGVSINPCSDIVTAKPVVMLVDKWLVHKRIPWSEYGGCVDGILDDGYSHVQGNALYVRSDIAGRQDVKAAVATYLREGGY